MDKRLCLCEIDDRKRYMQRKSLINDSFFQKNPADLANFRQRTKIANLHIQLNWIELKYQK